jgi:hypothetical protein
VEIDAESGVPVSFEIYESNYAEGNDDAGNNSNDEA